MRSPRTETPVRSIAARAFARLLDTEGNYRVQRGLALEHLRVPTLAAVGEDAAFAKAMLAELLVAKPANEEDVLTAGYLEHTFRSSITRYENELLGFEVTPYMGGYMLGAILQYAFVAFSGNPATYVSLAADYRDIVRERGARLKRQQDAGILLPVPAIAGARTAMLASKRHALEVIQTGAPSEARGAKVFDEVGKAYDDLLDQLAENYVAQASTTVGLNQYPGGASYYEHLVREHTASSMTPLEVHELGLSQVAELRENMANMRTQIGFVGSEEEFHQLLKTDPRIHATEPAEVDAFFMRHMRALEPKLSSYFSVLPRAHYGVKRLDQSKEAGMTYGYYEPPSPTEPAGYYRWNGSNLEQKSMLTYASLIFHELAPGHHFHIARQRENAALPDIRQEGLALGAFNEGWAEYAAGLGWEMGLYTEPLDAYGRLAKERHTAQRLVVDTGLNLLGWGLEKAAAYMRANTTYSDAQITSEVLRYSTDLPGQALAYRAGFIEFSRVRSWAENELADRFDIREFHEEVLSHGALPFPVIDAHIRRWANRVLAGDGKAQ